MSKHLNEKNENTEKVIHLLVTTLCDRNCKYCCNKQYSFDEIPTVTDEELRNAEIICLTGGEPFKYSAPNEIAKKLKRDYKNIKAVYVYTNAVELGQYIFKKDYELEQFNHIDGLNVSVKCVGDASVFTDYIVNHPEIKKMKSNLLYVFDNLLPKSTDIGNFVWKDRTWQPDFKPASDSIFRRI